MIKRALAALGLGALLRPLLGGAGAVLVFHRIRPRDPDWVIEANHRNCVAPDAFLALLDTLDAAGIEVVTLDEALARLDQARPRRFACLTFDDGYRDNHDTLLPILEARRVPATVYVAPGLIDGTAALWWYALDAAVARNAVLALPGLPALPCGTAAERHRAFAVVAEAVLGGAALADAILARAGTDAAALAARHMMGWNMVRRLAASPVVEIGAHTLTHPALATLSEAEAAAEIAGSRARLEAETGRAVRHFAYPYGTAATTGARERQLAAQAGFRTAVTTAPGNLSARHARDAMAWPRHGVGPADDAAALRLKLDGLRNPFAGVSPAR